MLVEKKSAQKLVGSLQYFCTQSYLLPHHLSRKATWPSHTAAWGDIFCLHGGITSHRTAAGRPSSREGNEQMGTITQPSQHVCSHVASFLNFIEIPSKLSFSDSEALVHIKPNTPRVLGYLSIAISSLHTEW